MILGVLFACRMRGGLLVLVWGSFWGWDMYGRILFENEGEGGGVILDYFIFLLDCAFLQGDLLPGQLFSKGTLEGRSRVVGETFS